MTVTVTTGDGVSTVTMSGKMDLAQSPHLRAQLLQVVGKSRLVVIDMKGVSSVDGAIVANLVEALERVKSNGGHLVLQNVGLAVRRVLEISKLDTVFDVAQTGEAG